MDETATLPLLPQDDLRRVLCVVAHPDDMEYGTSAAVAAWTSAGVEVTYLLLTHGEAGMAAAPEEVGPLRVSEQRRACAAVGVSDLRVLDHPDGMLEPTLAMRRDISRVIRQVRPDLVLTLTFEIEVGWGLNQADHRAAGLATIDACRDAANPWVFRELAEEEELAPWQAHTVAIAGHPEPTHAIPVEEDHVQASVASLQAHAAYLEHVTGHPEPAVFIPEMLRGGGQAAGTPHAVVLRVHDLAGPRREEE